MRRLLDFDPTTRPDGPWLRCPIPPALHAEVARVQAESVDWAIEMGLTVECSSRFERLQRSRFGWLAARCYAHARTEHVRLAADWITFLFFYDDLCDTLQAAGSDGDEQMLVALDARLVATLRGADPGPARDGFCRAMADIRVRLASFANEGWVTRIADDLALYLDGVRWERTLERSREPLTLAIYRHMRPMISAVNTCLDLAGAFIDGTDPGLGREPLVRELERIANDHISWVNDVFSLDRELAHGQSANLVVALARSERIGIAQALDRAIETCDAEMAAYVALETRLCELGSGDADAYVSAIGRWIRGSLDWHAESDRYRRAQQPTDGARELTIEAATAAA